MKTFLASKFRFLRFNIFPFCWYRRFDAFYGLARGRANRACACSGVGIAGRTPLWRTCAAGNVFGDAGF
jgi:hypothetical protein